MTTKEATHGIEVGLSYINAEGNRVVDYTAGVTAPELRVRAEEMNLKRPGSDARAVFRHVIYEDWTPITKIERVPHPTLRFSTTYKVS